MGFIEGTDRAQASLLHACVDDYIAPDGLVRVVDAFVDSLDLYITSARTAPAPPGLRFGTACPPFTLLLVFRPRLG